MGKALSSRTRRWEDLAIRIVFSRLDVINANFARTPRSRVVIGDVDAVGAEAVVKAISKEGGYV